MPEHVSFRSLQMLGDGRGIEVQLGGNVFGRHLTWDLVNRLGVKSFENLRFS